MNDTFSGYHPAVNFLYFVLVIGFSMFLMHPVCLALSLIGALAYAIRLSGRRAVRLSLYGLLPFLVFTAVLNPVFNHEGATILTYLPDGNPLTLEAILYGIAAATMMVTVILWFSCYSRVMTSDKFIFLFGRVIPALSLIFSMILRFVPRFFTHLRTVSDAQRGLGRRRCCPKFIRRMKDCIVILSVMLTWALEQAVTTADSMKSRGYGLRGRTAFSIFRFDRRDAGMLIFLLLAGMVVVGCTISGDLSWQYYPVFRGQLLAPLSLIAYAIYSALCLSPVVLDWREEQKWNALKSGI